MTLGLMFSPLVLEPKNFAVGDTIRVSASFLYTVPKDTPITVQAGPYQYKLGILDRIGVCFGSTTISLPATVTPTEKQFTIDFTLKATDGIAAGTYGLLVEIPGTDISVKQDDVLIIAGAANIWSMIGPLLVLGLMMGIMSMVMPKEE